MDEGIVEGGEDACDAEDELACKIIGQHEENFEVDLW